MASTLLAIAMGGGSPDVFAQSKPVIQLHLTKPQTTVYGSSVLVKDLANYIGPPSYREQVMNLVVENFDADSKTEISANQLRFLVLFNLSNRIQVETSGLDNIQVQRADQVTVQSELIRQLESKLAKQYQLPAEKIRVELPEASRILLKNNHHQIARASWVLPRTTQLPLGRHTLELQLEDIAKGSLRVGVEIGIMRELIMAKRTIVRGEVIADESISRIERPVFEPNVRLATYEQAVGTKAKSNILQYATIEMTKLDSRKTASPILVRSNQPIAGVLKTGTMKIEVFNLRARQNGKLGDMVEVTFVPTNKKMIGKVTKENFVELY